MTLGVRQIIIKVLMRGRHHHELPVFGRARDHSGEYNEPTGRCVRGPGGYRHVGPAHVSSRCTLQTWTCLRARPTRLLATGSMVARAFRQTAVFGTWKAAVKTIDQTTHAQLLSRPIMTHRRITGWNLGTCGPPDPVPAPTPTDEGYGTECRWNASTLV